MMNAVAGVNEEPERSNFQDSYPDPLSAEQDSLAPELDPLAPEPLLFPQDPQDPQPPRFSSKPPVPLHPDEIMSAIDEELDESINKPRLPPAALATAADFAALSPVRPSTESSAEVRVSRSHPQIQPAPSRRTLYGLLALLVLVLGGGGYWFFFLKESPGNSKISRTRRSKSKAVAPKDQALKPPKPDMGLKPIAKASPDAALAPDAQPAPPPRKMVAFLLESRPRARVFMGEKDLGKTPVGLQINEKVTYTLKAKNYHDLEHEVDPEALEKGSGALPKVKLKLKRKKRKGGKTPGKGQPGKKPPNNDLKNPFEKSGLKNPFG